MKLKYRPFTACIVMIFATNIVLYGFTPFLTRTQEQMVIAKRLKRITTKIQLDEEIGQISGDLFRIDAGMVSKNNDKRDIDFVRKARGNDPDLIQQVKTLAVETAKRVGLKPEVVLAIAEKESGIWPWTLNIEGKGYFFADKAELLDFLQKNKITWRHSFDAGSMQVNSQWGYKFDWDINKMLDLKRNMDFACWYLAENLEQYGDSWKAISKYHTPTEGDRAKSYAKDVYKRMAQFVVP